MKKDVLKNKKGSALVIVLALLAAFVVLSGVVLVYASMTYETEQRKIVKQQANYSAETVLQTFIKSLESNDLKRQNFLTNFVSSMSIGQVKKFEVSSISNALDTYVLTVKRTSTNQLLLTSTAGVNFKYGNTTSIVEDSVMAKVNYTLPGYISSAPSGTYCMMVNNYDINEPVDLTCNNSIFINNDFDTDLHKSNAEIKGNYNVYLNGYIDLKGKGSDTTFLVNIGMNKLYIKEYIDVAFNPNKTVFNIPKTVIYGSDVDLHSNSAKIDTTVTNQQTCTIDISKNQPEDKQAKFNCAVDTNANTFPNNDLAKGVFPSLNIDTTLETNAIKYSDLIQGNTFSSLAKQKMLIKDTAGVKDAHIMITSNNNKADLKEALTTGRSDVNIDTYYIYVDEKITTLDISKNITLQKVVLLANHELTINITGGENYMYFYAPRANIVVKGGTVHGSMIVNQVTKESGGTINITNPIDFSTGLRLPIGGYSTGTFSLIRYGE